MSEKISAIVPLVATAAPSLAAPLAARRAEEISHVETSRISQPHQTNKNASPMIQITLEDPKAVLRQMGAIAARQHKAKHFIENSEAARAASALYAREFGGENRRRIL